MKRSILAAAVLAVIFLNWMRADPDYPHAGQQCGPAHHWVYEQSNVAGGDLSCEAD